MEHLPKKTCQNSISYTLVGDYCIPALQLPEEKCISPLLVVGST